MRKGLLFILIAALCFSFCGCSSPAAEMLSDPLMEEVVPDAEEVYAADPKQSEAFADAIPFVLGKWEALGKYPAADNDLVLSEDGTGYYGDNAFTWVVDWADEDVINIKCWDGNGVLTYYLHFTRPEGSSSFSCSLSLVENYVDEGSWTMVPEDEAQQGLRYKADTLEFVEITAENFETYFEIRMADAWESQDSGRARFGGCWYYVLLRPDYVERLVDTERVIKLKYKGNLVYFCCDLDPEARQCTLGEPFPEIETESVSKMASFDMNNSYGFVLPEEYCLELLTGSNGVRFKETGDVYYTAVLENFTILECSGQLILYK